MSSFLLQDIPRHPGTRLFEVREAFIRSLLLGFQAHIRAYIAIFSPPAALRGPLRGACAQHALRPISSLSREDSSPSFPRRLASNCAYSHARRLAAIHRFYFFIFANTFKIPSLWDSNSRTNPINSSIRGLRLQSRPPGGAIRSILLPGTRVGMLGVTTLLLEIMVRSLVRPSNLFL